MLIYVDDIISTGINPQAITNLISTLNTEFALKDLSFLHFSLELMFNTHLTIFISLNPNTQNKY